MKEKEEKRRSNPSLAGPILKGHGKVKTFLDAVAYSLDELRIFQYLISSDTRILDDFLTEDLCCRIRSTHLTSSGQNEDRSSPQTARSTPTLLRWYWSRCFETYASFASHLVCSRGQLLTHVQSNNHILLLLIYSLLFELNQFTISSLFSATVWLQAVSV